MAEAQPISRSTFEALLIPFMRSRKLKGRSQLTVYQYTLAAGHLRTFMLDTLGDDNIRLVTRPVLEDFLIEHMAQRSSTTANKTFRQLRAWFNWLWNEDLIESNPFQGRRRVEAPEVIHQSKSGFSVAEAKSIISTIDDDLDLPGRAGWLAIRDRAILLVMYDTGLRATEITNMTIEGLDCSTGLFEVAGKGNSFYRRHLGKTALAAIARYTHRLNSAGISSGKLWRNHSYYSFTRKGLYDMCKHRAEDAGIRNGNPHRWRYTHGEVLQDLGWSEEIIMAEMGHSSLTVSRHYRENAIRRKALKQHEDQSPADMLVAYMPGMAVISAEIAHKIF